jgi:uncharacterized protein YndB with AHSA1/START domain
MTNIPLPESLILFSKLSYMAAFNWKQFTKRIPINASADAVYKAWTTREGLESWFLRQALFTDAQGKERSRQETIQADDHYHWLWFGYDDTAKEEKEVLAVNGKDTLQFSFSGDCIVTVTVKQEAGETICELTQQMTMEDEDRQRGFYLDCGGGWTFYLVNLKSILEGGVDLRNKNIAIRNVISA